MSSLEAILGENCSLILKEKEVLFAGLINKRGNLIAGVLKLKCNQLRMMLKDKNYAWNMY
jgi:hypothetical protein